MGKIKEIAIEAAENLSKSGGVSLEYGLEYVSTQPLKEVLNYNEYFRRKRNEEKNCI